MRRPAIHLWLILPLLGVSLILAGCATVSSDILGLPTIIPTSTVIPVTPIPEELLEQLTPRAATATLASTPTRAGTPTRASTATTASTPTTAATATFEPTLTQAATFTVEAAPGLEDLFTEEVPGYPAAETTLGAPVTGGCPLPDVNAAASEVILGPSENLSPSPAQGQRLIVYGVIYDRECRPAAGLPLQVWQTDPEGFYGPVGSGAERACCFFQGEVTTDENGRFTLITVKPGSNSTLPEPAPGHIHIEGVLPNLTTARVNTELVFANDPYLPDNGYSNPPPLQVEGRESPQGDYLIAQAVILLPEGVMVDGDMD